MTRRFDNSSSPATSRSGFTLIELLVVITILGILASMLTVALLSTQERIRVDRTRETIAKLNTLVMAKWDSYKTRRIPLPPPTAVNAAGAVVSMFNSTNPNRELALARLDYTRELMRLEMPERFTDIFDNPVLPDPSQIPALTGTASPYATWAALFTSGVTKMDAPAVTYAYRAALAADGITSLASVTDRIAWNQSAECLYLLVTIGLEGPTNREWFTDDEIRDTDSDGLLEFVDGWGRPIYFLRWAPGFAQNIVNTATSGSPVYQDRTGFVSALQSADADSAGNVRDPDPFDPMRVDMRNSTNTNLRALPTDPNARYTNFALYPLIYSSGQDKAYGIVDGSLGTNAATAATFRYSQTATLSTNGAPNDPYVKFTGITDKMGTPKRQVTVTVSGVDYGVPTRPTVSGNAHVPGISEAIEGTLLIEGDYSDNIHNQADVISRQ